MKKRLSSKLLFSLIFFSCNQSYTQNYTQTDQVVISFPEYKYTFAGYDNLIQVTRNGKNAKDIQLVCTACDTLYPVNINQSAKLNQWIFRKNTSGELTIQAINKKGKILSSAHITVFPIPVSCVYLDSTSAQSVIRQLPEKINVKQANYIPIRFGCVVRNWKIQVDTAEFSGNGKNLSQAVLEQMQINKKGIILLTISYFDPSRLRETKELFEYDLE